MLEILSMGRILLDSVTKHLHCLKSHRFIKCMLKEFFEVLVVLCYFLKCYIIGLPFMFSIGLILLVFVYC